MARHVPAIRDISVAVLLSLLFATTAAPQGAPAASAGTYLVFPFEKLEAAPRLDWLGEGLAELAIAQLASAGQQPFSRAERLSELERYGLPPSSQLSRASMIRIAQDLDADYVVFGSFSSDSTVVRVEARLLTVSPTALSPPVREDGPVPSVMDMASRLVSKLVASHPASAGAAAARQPAPRVEAFEHYIRGLTAADDEVRIRELREASRLAPTWPDALFALGQTYLQRSDCTTALSFFGRLPRSDTRYREAQFSSGVCHLLLNQPEQAEAVFSALEDSWRRASPSADSPELLNNLAIARARQGKTAAAVEDLRRAADLDPEEDDYTFNLGLMALRGNSAADAAEHFRQAAESEPDNSEDRALLIYSLEKQGKKDEAAEERSQAQEAFGPGGIPALQIDAKGGSDPLAKLDRIKTEIDPAEFRLETMVAEGDAARFAATASTPAARVRLGRQELSAGNLSAAEQEFRAALSGDPRNAAAHLGLADIRRKQNQLDEAVLELQASLETRDSAAVRTTLARVYLEQRRSDLARAEAAQALKLAPNYAPAKQLFDYLQKNEPKSGPPTMGPNPKPGAKTPPSPNTKPNGGER